MCCSGTSRFCCLKRSCKHKCRIKPHSPGQAKQVSASWAASLPHPAMDTGCFFLRWCWDHRVLLHVSLVTIVPHQGLSLGNSVSCRIYFPRWVEVVNRHFQNEKSRFAQKKSPGVERNGNFGTTGFQLMVLPPLVTSNVLASGPRTAFCPSSASAPPTTSASSVSGRREVCGFPPPSPRLTCPPLSLMTA